MKFEKFKLILRIFLINFSLSIIVLITAELFFGNWLKNNNYQNLLIPRYVKNIIDNPPYKSKVLGIYSRDQFGFRANKYPLNTIDILVIGGSTTEERDVDDQLIWTKVLENNFANYNNKKVLNAGIGGQTSLGHVKIFDLWLSRYKELKPEIILFYIGINDALFMLESIRKKNKALSGRTINLSNRDNLIYQNYFDNIIQYIKNNSAMHLLYVILKGNYISKKYKLNYNTTPTMLVPKYVENISSEMNLKDLDLDSYLFFYETNLKNLLEYSNQNNAVPIFITQTVANNHWIKKYLAIINKRTIKFCLDYKIKCIDLANLISFDENIDFYDGIHTTPKGSKKIGEFLFKKIYY